MRLAVEAQDRQPVLLHAGDRRLEAVTLESHRLRLSGGYLLFPLPVSRLLPGLDPGGDDGRDGRRSYARFAVGNDMDVVGAGEQRLDLLHQARSEEPRM